MIIGCRGIRVIGTSRDEMAIAQHPVLHPPAVGLEVRGVGRYRGLLLHDVAGVVVPSFARATALGPEEEEERDERDDEHTGDADAHNGTGRACGLARRRLPKGAASR